jgi:hypothetical protein
VVITHAPHQLTAPDAVLHLTAGTLRPTRPPEPATLRAT